MKRSPGFVLIEMLIAIGLLAVAGLIWTQVLRMAAQASRDISQQQPAEMRVDQAIRELRNDAWSASDVQFHDPHWLSIRSGEGVTIEWRCDKGLSRQEGSGEPQRWEVVAPDLSFRVRRATIVLELKGSKQTRDEQVEVVSETMLLSGRPQ